MNSVFRLLLLGGCLLFLLGQETPLVRADAGLPDHPIEEVVEDDRDYNKPPINPDRSMLELFIVSIVLFGAFVFLARSMVWKPLIAALDQREARVNRAYAEAEAARAEAERLLASHDARMAEVHDEVQQIVSKARKEAEAEKLRIIAQAEEEAARLREQAIAEIRQAHADAMQELEQSIDRQATLAVEHVVGQPSGAV